MFHFLYNRLYVPLNSAAAFISTGVLTVHEFFHASSFDNGTAGPLNETREGKRGRYTVNTATKVQCRSGFCSFSPVANCSRTGQACACLMGMTSLCGRALKLNSQSELCMPVYVRVCVYVIKPIIHYGRLNAFGPWYIAEDRHI